MVTPLNIAKTPGDIRRIHRICIRLGLYGAATRTVYSKGQGMIAMGRGYSALCHVSPTSTWPSVSGASLPPLHAVQASCRLTGKLPFP